MSTSPENNDHQTTTSQRDEAPVLEEPAPHDTPDAAEQDADRASGEAEEWQEAPSAGPAPAGGIVSAETFSIAGLLALSAVFFGVRLTELLPSLVGQSQEGVFAGIIAGDGAVALIAVALAVVSLLLANKSTRPWARWVATATIIAGVIFLAGAVTAYTLVPEPQPQPPMMPG
ncbi:hypothetical protein, partial [Allosalinactinospora lopnorensis]|uniref:hypothetical protein n=1 Tax=Allosalinactinospora lopnorensis TaxID=1352348 RepID=UPI0006980C2F